MNRFNWIELPAGLAFERVLAVLRAKACGYFPMNQGKVPAGTPQTGGCRWWVCSSDLWIGFAWPFIKLFA